MSATAGSAYALGLDAHVGSVEPGKLADLLVLDGDPLQRPEVLSRRDRIWLVIRHGAPVAGAALERSVDQDAARVGGAAGSITREPMR